MPDVNPQDWIDELRVDIKTKNKIKTQLVLSHFDEMDEQIQKTALQELNGAEVGFIIPVLVAALAEMPQRKAGYSELKEILFAKALDGPQVVTQLLIREAKPNRRILLAEIVGEIRLESAMSVLLSMLNEDSDERVLCGVINAIGMVGDPSATTPVSEFLYSGSVELIIAAIQTLGQLGTPTALQRLADKLGADQDLDLMILEVFASSQDDEALERLNATLSAHQARLRNAGKQYLKKIGPKAVPVLIKNLRYHDPDLLIHTLNVLGDIGDESAIAPIRKLLFNEPKDPNVRFAAYEALGRMPVAKGAFALAQGLHDPVDNVRSAAAHAIDCNYSTVLAAGIKNMVRDEEGDQRLVSRTLIDALCDKVVIDLIDDPHFNEFALIYLAQQAHADTRNHYIALLNANATNAPAEQITSQIQTETRDSLKVFAVDDSKMILNIYRSVLHNLGCDPVLFEFPADAIKEAQSAKPDLVFTDLNMPEISGIELTHAIRQWFSKKELPIIMVTTQNETTDNDAAMEAGITAILHKPFNEETLKAAMDEHLKFN
jgi:CheY-like chemotaxis protein/HEAT repeat protein